ncbi:hypothetical protein KAT24_02350 [Candidatus Pacearchaeota archaeon]|nr:hypothetical protein [Candidatus Pacearchaeota archaeon]
MKPKIKYVSKKKLYPAFGDTDTKKNIAYVRNDLPKIVKKFIKEHELYHLKDKSKNWFWREIKANVYGLFKHPFGFLLCVIMSLAPYRLRFYFERFRKGE